LREILFSPGGVSSPIMPGNEVYVSVAGDKFDATGQVMHEPTV
jgi:hypothetical protein